MADDNTTGLLPASAPAPSAASRVFHITELLEKILEEVATSNTADDVHTLLLSQRTCKAFHGTISDSPTLRRALFFDRNDDNPVEYNPLLLLSRIYDVQDATRMQYSIRWMPTDGDEPCEAIVSVRRWQSEGQKEGIEGSWCRMHLFKGYEEPVITAVYFSGLCRKRVEGRWVNPKLGEILELVNAGGTD